MGRALPVFDALLPPEMAAKAEQIGVAKAGIGAGRTFVLAGLVGAFIALGAVFATTVTSGAAGVLPGGVTRLLSGLAFSPRPTTRSRTTLDVPAALSTLASAVPGQAVEVRTVLDGVGESVATLRPRDLLTCRARTADWLGFEQNGRTEVAVHRCDAGRVCIERETSYVMDAAHGAASR